MGVECGSVGSDGLDGVGLFVLECVLFGPTHTTSNPVPIHLSFLLLLLLNMSLPNNPRFVHCSHLIALIFSSPNVLAINSRKEKITTLILTIIIPPATNLD